MNSSKTDYNWHLSDIRPWAVVVSLLISVFTILVPDTPNDDAYIYVRTAEIFLDGGLGAAYQHYAWASYSILIGILSQLGFSLFTSAYLINGLFYALLVYSFLSIVRMIDDSRPVMLMATLCVLFYPQLNEYRYLIIRDVGFWALSLFALWQFMLYTGNRLLKHGIAFCIALLLAAAFRAEAIVYLLLTPTVLLFDRRYSKQECRRLFIRFMTLAIGSVVAAAVVAAIAGMNIGSLFVDFISVYEPFISSTFSPSAAESSEIGRALFGEHASAYSQEYILFFLAAGLLVILAANLFNGIGGPFFWLLVYGWYKQYIRIDRVTLLPIVFYMVINAIILFGFLYVTRYLSSRYAMLFCLLLALAVPLVLARIIESMRGHKLEKVGLRVLILFFGYCGFDSFISFGGSKDYVFDSVEWIVSQSDEGTGVVTNNHAIAYYSGRVEDYDDTARLITADAIRAARRDDLIALEMHYEMVELVASDGVSSLLEFQTAFPNLEDRQVVIYKRVNR